MSFCWSMCSGLTCMTVCPSGLRGWTQVPLARAAWVQIPQVSLSCRSLCVVGGLGHAGGIVLLSANDDLTLTAVGFEPTQLALVELESTPLDHSGKLSC